LASFDAPPVHERGALDQGLVLLGVLIAQSGCVGDLEAQDRTRLDVD
jgi:hypothetical protein